MGFWQSEECTYCGGTIVSTHVDLHRKIKGSHHILIENIPAGVCTSCGSRFYVSDVLKTIERTIRKRQSIQRSIQVPVYSLITFPDVVVEDTVVSEETLM